MPSRRSYLATICSGTILLAGCGSSDLDDEEDHSTETDDQEVVASPTPEGTDTPEDDETPSDGIEAADTDYLNIRDYGAAVDGTTDDTTAIRQAIRAATENDTVVLPEGTILVSTEEVEERSAVVLDTEVVPANLTITGQGYGSILKLADGQEAHHKVFSLTGGGQFDNLELSQFRIDGNKRNQMTTGGHGIRLDTSAEVSTPVGARFQNLWIERCNQTGISLRRGGVVIDQVTVRECSKHGISTGHNGENITDVPQIMIRRSLFERNGKDGSGVTYGINCSGGKVLVSDCVCRNNAQGTKTTGDSIEVTYRRVRLENNDHHGYIRAGGETKERSLVTFEDVVSRNNGETGFRFSRDTDYVVTTQILASSNGTSNIRITNDASVDAETVWASKANGSYGIVCDSVTEGSIQNYYPHENEFGPLDTNSNLDIVNQESKNRDDLQTVPRSFTVGAGQHGGDQPGIDNPQPE